MGWARVRRPAEGRFRGTADVLAGTLAVMSESLGQSHGLALTCLTEPPCYDVTGKWIDLGIHEQSPLASPVLWYPAYAVSVAAAVRGWLAGSPSKAVATAAIAANRQAQRKT